MTKEQRYELLNGLALAYMGDAIYELHIRHFLMETGQTKPNILHKTATRYVSAKAQAYLAQLLLAEDQLTEEELVMYKRGRNAKSYTSAKNADIVTYRISTGFEALFGYLYLTKQLERIDELVAWCIQRIGERNEK